MGVKKLTGEQILEILNEQIGEDGLSDYAYNEFYSIIPDDFKFTPEVQKQVDDYNNASEAYLNHPDCSWKVKNKSEEFLALKDKYNSLTKPYTEMKEQWLNSIGLGPIEEIDQYGGEDMGSTWYSIKHFVDHDVYIRTDGYYQSYNDTEFYEGFGKEVTPKQKTVTVYE